MCMSSAPAPVVQPLPPPAPEPPKKVDEVVKRAKTDNKQRAALAAGRGSTIVTAASGLEPTKEGSGGKTILGA